MKSKSFFLTLVALLVASFGLAFAGSITIDHMDGVWDDGGTDRIEPNKPVNFFMRFTNNNGAAVEGMATAWKVYIQGVDESTPAPGGSYTPVTIDTMPLIPGWVGYPFNTIMWDQGFSLTYFSADGSGADTVGINGLKSDGFGFEDGFDEVAVAIYTGGVAEGDILCIDSTFAPPTAYWMWAPPGEGDPVWEGPYCYLALTPPNFPPTITNCPVGEQHFDHCVAASITFLAEDVESDAITFEKVSGPGTVTVGGVWSYAPTIVDAEVSTLLEVRACDDFEVDHCGPICAVDLWFDNVGPTFATGCEAYNVNNNSVTDFPFTADDDCDALTYSVVSITPTGGSDPLIGTMEFLPGTGTLRVTTDTDDDGTYDVVVMVSDTKATDECTVAISVIPGSLYQIVIGEVGEQSEAKNGGFVYQGQHVMVPVMLNAAANDIGGYDMLIAYDASALSFQAAYIGAEFGPAPGCGWEYFTYRFGADGNCGNACPSGLLTVTAIAETNNGPLHPDCFLPDPLAVGTVLFNLDFLVTNDYNFQCSFVPIRFFWMDCTDNALSDEFGEIMLISDAVYDGYDPEAANGKMNIYNPLYGMYPTYFGAQDIDCFTHETKVPLRAVSFENGGVWIACVDSIDDRGDINLNNVAYEIADAVLYSNYFVYGLGVFNVNLQGQIAASDVNADGLTLSVADLVYLIRVVIGDALPYAKIAPAAINFTVDAGMVNVESAMGAAYVVVEGDATPTLLVDNMEMRYAYDADINATRVLVYSMEEGATFDGTFLNANGTVVSAEFATYEGAPVTAKLVPTAYSLSQNYPNPFNPTTNIAFDLPQTSDYSLRVFNVTGQKVAEFAGSSEAGTVVIEWDAQDQASGIYFYKLAAGNFTATKKMVLLK